MLPSGVENEQRLQRLIDRAQGDNLVRCRGQLLMKPSSIPWPLPALCSIAAPYHQLAFGWSSQQVVHELDSPPISPPTLALSSQTLNI